MRNTIRCCISCILPCGALDVIRIVHVTGRVEEISGSNITAADILKSYPKHVLKRPSSSATSADSCCPKIVVVSPEDELRRGKIYFLIPVPPSKSTSRRKKKASKSSSSSSSSSSNNVVVNNSNENDTARFLMSDRYLSEILSEKMSTVKDRRRGRAGVWRPHLESISEATGAHDL